MTSPRARLVVIDDEKHAADALAALLRDDGYEASVAYDAEAARLLREAGVEGRVERRRHDIAANPTGVEPADVVAQIRAMPASALAAALGATAIGYVALIFYDWFGLRFIGKKLDRGIVALGGFLGCAFGNTIGVSVVSGGGVR